MADKAKRRRTKAEKAFEERVDRLEEECTDRVQLDIWDLGKVRDAAEKAAKEHADDAAAKESLMAFLATIRKN